MNAKSGIVRAVLAEKAAKLKLPVQLMEVCGSHSFAIAKAGIRDLLPQGVKLLSGPGCPVCVSGEDFLMRAITLCRKGVQVALFGDLLRIPSPLGTLGAEKGLLVLYSPEEALSFAAAHPRTEVVFAAVGFEPTLAVGAALMAQAEQAKLENFSLLCDFKNLRPVLDLLAADASASLNGFLLPGHVAAVIGEQGFAGLRLPGVIAGFSPENIIGSLGLLLDLLASGRPEVLNHYPAVVRKDGNRAALNLIHTYFETGPGQWRGMGVVPGGNWQLRKEFERFDAMKRYQLESLELPHPSVGACRCGEVLRGRIAPEECGLFGKNCTVEHPVGACMVSTEGACAAQYQYRKARRAV